MNQSTLPEDKGCHKLITEGININVSVLIFLNVHLNLVSRPKCRPCFQEIIKNSHILNVSKLYLNDIHRMAATFGIEAAAKVIINVSLTIRLTT